jgi:hypothetical protein
MRSLLCLALAALCLIGASCDKHSWKDTQVLHEGMHKAGHGDSHAKDSKDSHGNARDDKHAPKAAH